MSLDKAVAHRKERRKPYRGSARFDPACRKHGVCPWCVSNRTHQGRKERARGLVRDGRSLED